MGAQDQQNLAKLLAEKKAAETAKAAETEVSTVSESKVLEPVENVPEEESVVEALRRELAELRAEVANRAAPQEVRQVSYSPPMEIVAIWDQEYEPVEPKSYILPTTNGCFHFPPNLGGSEIVHDGIITTDHPGRIEYLDAAVRAGNLAEFTGKLPAGFVPADPRRKQTV